MNPLSRLLATSLFVVLATLTAVLVTPVWRARRADVPAAPAPEGSSREMPPAPASLPAARLARLPLRFALVLACTGVLLAAALVVSQAGRPARREGSHGPFDATRTEVGALSKLAASSAAQSQELTHERDVRRRAEEDVQLKQQLLTQSLEEKIRLGRDLHDGIIQSLYAVGLTLESARDLLPRDPVEADRRLEQCRTALNGSIRDARAYITGLAPDNLRRTSFVRALESLVAELRSGREVRFDLKIDDDATVFLTAEQTIEALQIAREAVSNALRHGHATVITVRVHKSDREVCLLVQDNGRGFDAKTRRDGGHGLGNMGARAAQLGATLNITSQPGEGSRVLANLPILHQTVSP
jgi:signal transduction histidine kinase